jgi:ANTAR domain/GAF domain
MGRAVGSGRAAVLVQKSTQDVEPFHPLNLRQVSWHRLALCGLALCETEGDRRFLVRLVVDRAPAGGCRTDRRRRFRSPGAGRHGRLRFGYRHADRRWAREAVPVKASGGKQCPSGSAVCGEADVAQPDDVDTRFVSRGQPSTKYNGQAPHEIAQTLSELARSLENENSLQETLNGIVAAAVHTVPGAQYAGITAVQGRRNVSTAAATDELARNVDQAQYETGQGPCLDAAYQHQTIRLSDMASENRWPEFTARASAMGIRSMLSIQLYVVGDDLGALTLYSGETDAFGDESEDVGLLFASHAAVAMAGARREQDLSNAISMRDLIGQAKGILMERHKITADEAFVLLARASQRMNTKLTAIAQILTTTGELPRPPGRGPSGDRR